MKIRILISLPLLLLCSCNHSHSSSSEEPLVDELIFSHPSGFYSDAFSLTIQAPDGFDIFYTMDCSDPTELSSEYTKPITIKDVSSNPNYFSVKPNISSLDVYYPSSLIDKCQVIKVIGINKETKEVTPISSLNYFVGFQNKSGYENMPIVSLTMNEEDLYDYVKGIYVTGKIYDESEHTGYPETYPTNYHQKGIEWERKANFKYFETDRSLSLEQDIGVRIHGGWSRAFNQKSFNLYARKEYSGSSSFEKDFFYEDVFPHSMMLRSGGYRDTAVTKVRDSLVQDFSQNESFDTQRSFPVITFLNGEYWGIYNLQERFSDNYVKEHHGVSKKNVLIIKNDEIDEGETSDYHYYEELKEFFSLNSFSSMETYEQAKRYIDMEEFASYMAMQLYVGNIDWPGNNVRVWKDVSDENGKWHFMMYDTDDSINMLPSKCAADVDPFLKSSHWKSGPLETDCLLGLLLSKLVENGEFKTLFRNTFIRIGSSSFSTINTYLDGKKALLSQPMIKNYQRFVSNEKDAHVFNDGIEVIRDFFDRRYDYAISYLNLHIQE